METGRERRALAWTADQTELVLVGPSCIERSSESEAGAGSPSRMVWIRWEAWRGEQKPPSEPAGAWGCRLLPPGAAVVEGRRECEGEEGADVLCRRLEQAVCALLVMGALMLPVGEAGAELEASWTLVSQNASCAWGKKGEVLPSSGSSSTPCLSTSGSKEMALTAGGWARKAKGRGPCTSSGAAPHGATGSSCGTSTGAGSLAGLLLELR